ncbi:hypothetical protein [Oceanirhabdus seepicola]|uniref:Pilus assembly PilX N-terminal domain-containing protein n=1 Tax=Oceanirhabdus seepicola TaxID=2828781 RepID=A0A9J6P4Y3_9CLOT|nr:hypothetical protein [Oceanirhabdus seepicola]MCM1990845.1 pilus assembly PilX N-terminal domain-containing protein [Oceanirhabdus seepicola]
MRKKRGSILIYVMTIFAVLMIMGATLTTLTLQSMKNRKYYSNSRVNLYYSESGIDEAYGVASEYVKLASNYAHDETNKIIEAMIEEDKEKLEKIFLMRQVPDYEQRVDEIEEQIDNMIKLENINLVLFNKYGELIEESLKTNQDNYFKISYIDFFNLKDKENIDKMIASIENYQDPAGDDDTLSLEVTNKEVIKESVITNDGFNLNVVSTFNNEGIEKIIAADLNFTVPNYGSKLSFPTKYKVFPESPVWNKGLVVNETLSIRNATLNVNGDAYVNGEDKDGVFNGKDKVAIQMNSHKSNLTVNNGKVIACEGVKFDYNFQTIKSNGAKVNITGGNLYTKGVLFNKGAQGADLSVKHSIYVLDDCEINAKNSTLNVGVPDVGGSYYGVSSGEGAADNEVDNSSSIIINSEDLGEDGSSVNIEDKVYLAGTSYIKGLKNPVTTGTYDYQTGESISIKGNYKAYSGSLNGSLEIGDKDLKYELQKNMLSPLVLATNYNKYSKWFTIYTEEGKNEIYLGMDNQLKEKYEGALYKIDKVGDRKFRIGNKELLIPVEMDSIKDSNELSIELVNGSGEVIEVIKVPKLQNNIEAFLYIDDSQNKNVFVTITPKGKMEDSLNGASAVVVKEQTSEGVIKEQRGSFDEFIAVSEAVVGQDISIDVHCDGRDPFNTKINLLSYSTYFQNFNVYDKSKYFKQFYDENKNKIEQGNGITIKHISDSIYTGAIISNKSAFSTNYGKENYDNDYLVRQKKAELKDKIYYMDMFENKSDNNYNQDIGKYDILGYKSLINPPENVLDYEVTPHKLLKIDHNVKPFNNGLYISKGAETKTVLTDKGQSDSSLDGERVMLNNNSFGIIICEGDVYLEGDFEFTGTIITLGDLYVVDGSNVKIYYDDALVKRVVARNYDTLKNVFKSLSGYELDKVKVEVYDNNTATVTPEPNTSVPLTIEKWVVVK